MPPPTVICSICGVSVFKAQTYHVGDGKRACKAHEGVAAMKDELEQQKALARERQCQQEKARAERAERTNSWDSKNRCWVCRREAIREQDFWASMMVANEKMRLKGINLTPLDQRYHERVRSELHLDEKKLLVTSLYPFDKNEKKIDRFPPMTQQMASLARVVSVCQDCAAAVGLEKEVPDVPLDKLAAFSAVYNVLVKPTIVEIAKGLIADEAQSN